MLIVDVVQEAHIAKCLDESLLIHPSKTSHDAASGVAPTKPIALPSRPRCKPPNIVRWKDSGCQLGETAFGERAVGVWPARVADQRQSERALLTLLRPCGLTTSTWLSTR